MSTQTETQTQSEDSQTDTAQVDTPQTEPPQAETGPPTPLNSAQTLHFTRDGEIGILTLDRPAKRNALDDQTISGLGEFFAHPPEGISAIVLSSTGEHFCAGLDLSEMTDRDAVAGLHHSRGWHTTMNAIAESAVPVIAVLQGAVIGGGLELASAAHLRVAEDTAYFALPEGKRGLFVGGGASVRVPRLIGLSRVQDMMLTGRTFDAAEAEAIGLVNYRVGDGQGAAKALELAASIAANSPVTNYAITQALPRIVESGRDEGYMMEALMAAVAQSSSEAKELMRSFLDGSGPKVTK
ncbi:crotonase/enoyl-CoA hydratase family protein [Brevibacterium sp. SMBL_HHYL_HB1]|jgi:enoyl-CoA hydratase/carnithine racemase|uniref:crotonase/enoyl-CoA hydratase family protein n=1 Tax=Brevibacterium sp. SMBL_HHYL_HB1 TaxID=2777556 RepID=UPI001BABE1A1|nr:crotonase/enoyl-CoA hydratase family protein [Brevibacterium sp. SMBL_HHYL_HB1]QUL78510.1 crotonase/enoyl-CoA hydratase family protein [Brevibacterium sp. SMBL_HHYL_HB1]